MIADCVLSDRRTGGQSSLHERSVIAAWAVNDRCINHRVLIYLYIIHAAQGDLPVCVCYPG